MSLFGVEDLCSHTSASVEEDFLIWKILLTHDPDGSQLDSSLLLRAVEDIILHASPISVVSHPEKYTSGIFNGEAIGLQGSILFKISNEILNRCFEEGDIHTNTMFLFEMLGKYRWDEKVVLVVAAFLMKYGEFQLIVKLQSHNPLAELVAVLRKTPCDLTMLRRQFKVLMILVKTMIELTKAIIEFENLPLQQDLLELKAISAAKSKIYMASYWIFRSSIACFSLITSLRTTKNDQVDSNPTTVAAWTLSNLSYRLSGLCCELRVQVDTCHKQIGTRLPEKLLNLFKLSHVDNEEKLRMIIPLKDDFPLKDCLSKEKVFMFLLLEIKYVGDRLVANIVDSLKILMKKQEHSISELKNKMVIFLVSKPELLPVERIFLLVQQTRINNPDLKEIEGNYVILWFPIVSSCKWTQSDEMNFHILSNCLPFWSLRQPWLLNSAVVDYFIQEWNFKDDSMMVVLDANGTVSNSNATDMVWIWGPEAYPFSVSREKELWEMQDWTLQLILDNIDPLLTLWIDQNRNLCIYASDNLDWIRHFCTKMRDIKETGLQLEVIYVGWQNPSENLHHILDIIKQEKLSASLSLTKIYFFWLRLQSMKNSSIRQKHTAGCDRILKEVTGLLEVENTDDSWMVIGRGHSSNLEKLQGSRLSKFFDLFPLWAENVGTLGLVDAVRSAFEPPLPVRPCHHLDILPYKEELMKGTVICKECKRPREKFIVYRCEETMQEVQDPQNLSMPDSKLSDNKL